MTIIHDKGIQQYSSIWEEMKQFTQMRQDETEDELWLLEHFPVYTQGQAGKAEHILNHNEIPIIQSDRGGQVTYHGPGQLVGYTLLDLRRRKIGIRTLVCNLEELIIELLKQFGITAQVKCGAPGVYVQDAKIASVGLRVKNSCTYHGIALNVDMDLNPFNDINPCGFNQLKMAQMKDFIPEIDFYTVKYEFTRIFLNYFK
jgi:lipoyl(octanoyl) transferase